VIGHISIQFKQVACVFDCKDSGGWGDLRIGCLE